MLRRSVTNGLQRKMALLRSCCAPLALALLFSALEQGTLGKSPALGGPPNTATDQSAAPKLPPPASRPVAVNPPLPAMPTEPQPAAAAIDSTTARSSKASD